MSKTKIILICDDDSIKEETKKEARDFFKDRNFVNFIGMFVPPRPGVELCFTELEHTYFPPKTDMNKDFFFRILTWRKIIWAIVSIPITQSDLMEKIADKNGLELVPGTPIMFALGKKKRFPFKKERMFTLENKKSHPFYLNNPIINNVFLAMERKEINRIVLETQHRIDQDRKNKSKHRIEN